MSFLSIREYLEPLLGVKLPASPADGYNLGTRCKLGILPAGGTTTPDTMSRTVTASVHDVIDSLKVSNGYTDKLSNVSSKEELQKLCNELNTIESLLRRITRSYYFDILEGSRSLYTEKVLTLTQEERTELARLRERRIELLSSLESTNNVYYRRLDYVNQRLYELTDYQPYKRY